jgi:two-component system, NtrC family, response regulator AtoC
MSRTDPCGVAVMDHENRVVSSGSVKGVVRRVLLVEDDTETRTALQDALQLIGFEVEARADAESALDRLAESDFDAVLTDLRMAGMGGLDLCSRVINDGPQIPVVIMTAFEGVSVALDALRAGACDFLTKPFSIEQLRVTLERALTREAPRRQGVQRLPGKEGARPIVRGLLGASPGIQAARAAIGRAAGTEFTVLISGESGTGKELAARAIHDASCRTNGPFVAISCAALPSAVLEAELFGHSAGAFTGAARARDGLFVAAHGGTLFLDEIGDMPLELQPKLSRVLEQRALRPVGASEEVPFDVRIVAATHRDLGAAVACGDFRQELFFRLNVLNVHLPPLRERSQDIVPLAEHFLAQTTEPGSRELTPRAREALVAYDWPGNVRELQNCIQAAGVLAHDGRIGAEELPVSMRWRDISAVSDLASLADVERHHIAGALAATSWNKALAARFLGIDRTTLYRKMKRYGLEDFLR